MTRTIAGADVGGTFTDIALYDDATRTLSLNKLLTTPDDPRRAIIDGLAALATRAEIVVHGTTLVTNAIVEDRVEPVALVATQGFEDVLDIGRGGGRALGRGRLLQRLPQSRARGARQGDHRRGLSRARHLHRF